jgi:hypothetical protein
MGRRLFGLATAVLLVTAVACETQKSNNPLSPSVAGPMEGVDITPPRVLEPGQGAKYKESQQPIKLSIENASTSGVRPLYYTFEVATDSAFQTKMYARSKVPPGPDGRTSVQIDRLELGRSYYWRVRAEDGANTGPFATVQFDVLPRPVLGAPAPLSPVNNARTSSLRPTLTVGAAARNAGVGAVVYEFQVATDGAFAHLVAAGLVNDRGGQTSFTPGGNLASDRQHFWRARAKDGETAGPWSAVQGFVTPASGGPAPGPGPAPGGPCISSSPEAIVACERSKFGHMNDGQLVAFLRAVARSLNSNGISGRPYGVLRKDSGNNCHGYSCDIICAGQGNSQRQWDVLGDVDGDQSPGWSGPKTVPNIRIDVCEIQ